MIEQVLENIGLTKNETKTYLALLELGECKTGQILEKSGLNSGKIYEILDSLQKKGIVSMVTKDGIKYYSPANPKRVLDYLGEKKREIEDREKEFVDILPKILDKINLSKDEVKIEIFSGIKGFKTAYSQELDFPKSETLYILGINPANPNSGFAYDYLSKTQEPKREQRRYKVKKLLSEQARKFNQKHGRDTMVRYLPYDSLVAFNIIGNLTMIGIFVQEPIIISIKSNEVAKNFKTQFEILWGISRK